MRNGRLSSPLRAINPLFGEHANPQSISITSPLSLGHSVPLTNGSTHFTTQSVGISLDRSPEINKEREKQPMDYTDLEGKISIGWLTTLISLFFFVLVLTKLQLESEQRRSFLSSTYHFSIQICVKPNDKLLYPNVSVGWLITTLWSIFPLAMTHPNRIVISFSQWKSNHGRLTRDNLSKGKTSTCCDGISSGL